jgi:hypothetical protein
VSRGGKFSPDSPRELRLDHTEVLLVAGPGAELLEAPRRHGAEDLGDDLGLLLEESRARLGEASVHTERGDPGVAFSCICKPLHDGVNRLAVAGGDLLKVLDEFGEGLDLDA